MNPFFKVSIVQKGIFCYFKNGRKSIFALKKGSEHKNAFYL